MDGLDKPSEAQVSGNHVANLNDAQILGIAEAIRVAYLRGTKDPNKDGMTETIHEMRDFIIQVVT